MLNLVAWSIQNPLFPCRVVSFSFFSSRDSVLREEAAGSLCSLTSGVCPTLSGFLLPAPTAWQPQCKHRAHVIFPLSWEFTVLYSLIPCALKTIVCLLVSFFPFVLFRFPEVGPHPVPVTTMLARSRCVSWFLKALKNSLHFNIRHLHFLE